MPNNNIILICRAKYDSTTRYVYYWAEKIKEDAELLGFEVIDLKDEKFDGDRLKKVILECDPFLVFLSGHGTKYSIQGLNRCDVVIRCMNDHLFKDRIVYALSCSTSLVLGRSAKAKGCKCYIGYNDEIKFPFLEYEDGKVFEDEISEPFMKISNEIMLSLLRRKSPEESYKSSQILIDQLTSHWYNQERAESSIIIRWLKRIKNMQIMITE